LGKQNVCKKDVENAYLQLNFSSRESNYFPGNVFFFHKTLETSGGGWWY